MYIKALLKIVFLIILIIIAYKTGFSNGIGNQTLNYGDTGLPKNCRALIAASIEGVKSNIYTPEEVLASIDRNCGRNGYSWSER